MTQTYTIETDAGNDPTPLEVFRALREGDVLALENGAEWRVASRRTVQRGEPYVGTVRLAPAHQMGDVSPADSIDLRADSDAEPNPRCPFRKKNGQGEWGYEDVEAEMFDLVSLAERPDEERPDESQRYYDAILCDSFRVVEAGEFEVSLRYRSEGIEDRTVPRHVFSKRRFWMEYQTVDEE